jgi:hypothetical protein
MMTADAETDLAIDLETAGGCQEAERWRSQWILRWKNNAAMIDSPGVWRRRRRPRYREMPVEQIGIGDGMGEEMW